MQAKSKLDVAQLENKLSLGAKDLLPLQEHHNQKLNQRNLTSLNKKTIGQLTVERNPLT